MLNDMCINEKRFCRRVAKCTNRELEIPGSREAIIEITYIQTHYIVVISIKAGSGMAIDPHREG